jgi:hypothetical protein
MMPLTAEQHGRWATMLRWCGKTCPQAKKGIASAPLSIY